MLRIHIYIGKKVQIYNITILKAFCITKYDNKSIQVVAIGTN